MTELKTIQRRDPEFESYLRGTFSKTLRALPVQSLNVNTETESVTFQLVPVGQIKTPPFLQKWAQIFRARNFVFALFPMFLILVKNMFDEVPWDPLLAALSGLGALCLTLGAFLMNDFQDHMKGVDRVHPEGGSRAIQNGWVTAQATRNWSFLYLGLGVLLGVPAVFVFPELLWLLALPILVGAISLAVSKIGLKYRRGAELVVFLMYGPLLTVGYQIAIGGGFDLEAVWIGLLTGWHFTFMVHVKNFESLLVNSQAGFQNTMTFLGFERGKRFLEIWWLLFLVLMASYQYVYHSPDWFLVFVLVPIVFSLGFLLTLRRLTSPVGSQMALAARLARTAALLTLLLWALQSFYYGLVMELVSAT